MSRSSSPRSKRSASAAGIGSSGAGGVKLHRRHFGEQVENVAGVDEYHWMAGNFLKYGAADASFWWRTATARPNASSKR